MNNFPGSEGGKTLSGRGDSMETSLFFSFKEISQYYMNIIKNYQRESIAFLIYSEICYHN